MLWCATHAIITLLHYVQSWIHLVSQAKEYYNLGTDLEKPLIWAIYLYYFYHMQSSNAMFDVLNVIEISVTMQKHSIEQIYIQL